MTDEPRAYPTRDEFAALAGSSFTVDGTEVSLVVDSVDDVLPAGFAVLFSGPAEPALAQATYALVSDTVGMLHVFIVPIGSGAETTTYEAVFTEHQQS